VIGDWLKKADGRWQMAEGEELILSSKIQNLITDN
jgi:hypothetical protein